MLHWGIGLIIILLSVILLALLIGQICKWIDYNKVKKNEIDEGYFNNSYKRYYRQIFMDFGIPLIFLTIIISLFSFIQFL